jgi:Family of unknown function (DUF6528)
MSPRKTFVIGTTLLAIAAAALAAPGAAAATRPPRHRAKAAHATRTAHHAPPGTAHRIVVADQATKQILVLAADRSSWDHRRFGWRWRPTPAEGFRGFDLAADWGRPDEAKLGTLAGRRYLLTTDSKGLAAVVPYPQGRDPYWAADLGRTANPHSIDLLPDGDVAVVASDGGWLRVYTAVLGRRSASYAEFPLRQAHGVYWDRCLHLLWAVGERELVALQVGADPARPRLTVLYRAALPTGHGHDVAAVVGRPDRLWVTTGRHIYQYSKLTGRFVRDFPGAAHIDGAQVKSVGQDPSTGQILTATVQHGNRCPWCTDMATLFRPHQALTFPGGEFYKIRWWDA